MASVAAARGVVRGDGLARGRARRRLLLRHGGRRSTTTTSSSSSSSSAAVDADADADAAVRELLAWATSDALTLSPKVTVGVSPTTNARGLIATERMREGEDVLILPASSTAFDAAYARDDRDLGLKDAIDAYERDPNRGGDVTPEVALALLVALTRRHPEKTPFGSYVGALPTTPGGDSPLSFTDATTSALLEILPLSLVDAIDRARSDLYQLWDVAAAVMDLVVVPGADPLLTSSSSSVSASTATPTESELTVDEFFAAWMAIRSRAITFRVLRGDDGVVDARRCMVPVVDFMNHACAPPPGGVGDGYGVHAGPVVTMRRVPVYTSPRTIASARCTPFLEDFIISRRSFLSAQSSLSISALDAFRLRLTPLNSTPTFARTERRRPPAAARRASRGRRRARSNPERKSRGATATCRTRSCGCGTVSCRIPPRTRARR